MPDAVAERAFARIECNEAPAAGVFYLVALVLPLLAFGALWAFGVPFRFDVPAREFNPIVLLPVIALLASLFFLVSAVFMTLRLRRFGVSTLALDRRPRVGGRILGRISSSVDVVPREPWELGIRCVQTIKSVSSGRRHLNTDVIRWSYTNRLPPSLSLRQGIPIDVPIPADALAVADPIDKLTQDRGTLTWSLWLKGKRDGLDYLASFALPIRDARHGKDEG